MESAGGVGAKRGRGSPAEDCEYEKEATGVHFGNKRTKRSLDDARKPWELPISNYGRQRGYYSRLKQAKLEAQGVHPFPEDTHLLQHANPKVVSEPFTLNHRLLNHREAETRPWYSRKARGELVTVNHWGQRKLLISEIEFLTRSVKPGEKYTMVYAGAAPGSHLEFLSILFPQVYFILIDPAPFSIKEGERISIVSDYMTTDLANTFADTPNLLFVSDVRTANPRVMSAEEVEERVRLDNQLQMDWVKKMDPDASLLKFRLPYYEEKVHEELKIKSEEKDWYINYKYYDGDLYLPVWGGQSTTECRLFVPKKRKLRLYNTRMYQEQLFYFNTERRVQYFPHTVNCKGLCHCYDCRAEVFVLSEYIKKFKQQKFDMVSEIESLIPTISRKITPKRSGRTLAVVLPTKSDLIPEEEYTWEKAYVEQFLLHAPKASQTAQLTEFKNRREFSKDA